MRFSLWEGLDGMKGDRADERSVLYNSLLRQDLTIGGLAHQAYAGSDVGLVSISRLDGVVRGVS